MSRADAPQDLAFVREKNRFAAMGLAVAHLMARPAFAGASFGHIATLLAGQINRGDYAFVLSGRKVVGFAGWAWVDEALGEAWLREERTVTAADVAQGRAGGDCVLLNMWQADTPEVSRFIMRALAPELRGARLLFARRLYADGRARPVRLVISGRTNPLPPAAEASSAARPQHQAAGALQPA